MKIIRRFWLVAFIIFVQLAQVEAKGQTIRFAFGDGIQPWVLPVSNSGIIIDIIKETLEPAGYSIVYIYVPYARRFRTYRYRRADAITDVNPRILKDYGEPLEGYLSDIAYSYNNIGVSLKKNRFDFTEINQLSQFRIVAWQGAKAAIGEDFARMAERNSRYSELADQELQIRMLYAGRADVIPLDELLFEYYRNKVAQENRFNLDMSQPIDKFSLFGQNECRFLFRDQTAQIIFNRNLKKLKENGRYRQIIETYAKAVWEGKLMY